MKTRPSTFAGLLWRYFALFALAVLVMLWVLQTVFLQAFYDASVKAGVSDAAATIEHAWTTMAPEEFSDELDAVSADKSLLVFVATCDKDVLYATDEHSAAYASEDAGAGEADSTESYSWRNAAQNQESDGGIDATPSWQIGRARYLGLTQGFDSFLERLGSDPSSPVEYQDDDGALYTYGIALPASGQPQSACEAAGEDAVLYISTTLQPIGAAATAIRTQLIFASVAALLLALILAFALARRFSKPVEALTAKAARLAEFGSGGTGGSGTSADVGAGGKGRSAGGADGRDADVSGAGGDNAKPTEFESGFCAELDDLSRTIDDAASDLAEAERSRAEFMANVSHDLRTPLTLIKGYAEAARDDLRDGLPVDESDLEVVAREADRLADLANELLDYSKLRAGSAKLDVSEFDASEAFESAVALFAPLCERTGLTMTTQIDPGVHVTGDEAQLVRVVSNLVDNAVSHTPQGGMVTVSLSTSGVHVRLAVTDTGAGIPPEELERVWDRYFTKKQAARNAKGSGLGLAISKEILEAHGASYGASSDEGAGSCFWFEMALATIA